MELVIGTKAWSTWSLRPWLALKRTGAPFTERLIELRRDEVTRAEILPHSPSGFVPALKDGDLTVWDSLAICEYLAEKFPQAQLWPADPVRRALARSATAEMHSGFAPLRKACPMVLDETPYVAELSPEVQANVQRIVELWSGLLKQFGGPFLLGEWSIADAFFVPVATRIRSYGIHLSKYGDDGASSAYVQHLLADADFLAWEADSLPK